MNKTKPHKIIFRALLITAIAGVIGMIGLFVYVLYYDPPQPYGGEDIDGDYVIYTEGYRDEIDLYLYQISSDTTIKIFDDVPIFGYTLNISGKHVIWQDIKNDIYLYEIPTGTTKRISKNGENILINGDYIIWTDQSNNFKKVFLYQISTNETTRIAKTNNMWYLRTTGDYILWSGSSWLNSSEKKYKIFLYQISTNETRQIWNNPEPVYYPQLSSEHILWEGPENSLYLYHIHSNSVVQISDNADSSSLSNDYVAWEESDAGETGKIYLYQISTENTKMISNNQPTDAFFPMIYGNYISWDSASFLNTEQYIYDINSGDITEFFKDKPGKYRPQIDGDSFMWKDYSNLYVHLFGSDVIMKLNNGKSTKLMLSPEGTWEIQEEK